MRASSRLETHPVPVEVVITQPHLHLLHFLGCKGFSIKLCSISNRQLKSIFFFFSSIANTQLITLARRAAPVLHAAKVSIRSRVHFWIFLPHRI